MELPLFLDDFSICGVGALAGTIELGVSVEALHYAGVHLLPELDVRNGAVDVVGHGGVVAKECLVAFLHGALHQPCDDRSLAESQHYGGTDVLYSYVVGMIEINEIADLVGYNIYLRAQSETLRPHPGARPITLSDLNTIV